MFKVVEFQAFLEEGRSLTHSMGKGLLLQRYSFEVKDSTPPPPHSSPAPSLSLCFVSSSHIIIGQVDIWALSLRCDSEPWAQNKGGEKTPATQ